MEKIGIAIVGGGASGLFCANRLDETKEKVVVFERLDRVGKKLSATGNGQGNLTNAAVGSTAYFSHANNGAERVSALIRKHGKDAFISFIQSLGGLCLQDERGRVYPTSRQASSVTDLLRHAAHRRGVEVRLSQTVKGLEKSGEGFVLTVQKDGRDEKIFAEKVVLCAGGKAAKNFGTDGSGYSLATALGHTVTPTYPSLVQLKTDVTWTKTLKGIRVQDCGVRVLQRGKERLRLQGDVIFTDYGVSGDGVFRASAYIADSLADGQVTLSLDFLPQIALEELSACLQGNRGEEPLCGVVNNQIGRAILRRSAEEGKSVCALVKDFPLRVTGSLGFDYAQVTKGGVSFDEVDDTLQSVYAKGLYFAGEVLDVDGPCGGFNLQWAYTSACVVADAICRK